MFRYKKLKSIFAPRRWVSFYTMAQAQSIPEYLAELLLDTLDQVVDHMPTIYNTESNIAIVWPIKPDQDELFGMFSSRQDMRFFLDFIVETFEKNYKGYIMKAVAGPGPVMWEREGEDPVQACYIEFEWVYYDGRSIIGMPPEPAWPLDTSFTFRF